MSLGVNRCIFIGNVGRDPEIKKSKSGTTLAQFTIAVNKSWRDKDGNKQEKVTWVRCTAFGKVAENVIAKYVHKGDPIYVETEVENNDYEKDGVKHYGMQFVVQNIQLIGSKGGRGGERADAEAGSAGREAEPEGDIPF